MSQVIIILGAPNDAQGSLSLIAKARCDKALEVYQQNSHQYILCTGGFGAHFNVTSLPHAHYTQKYLEQHGVEKERFLTPALSRFTFEDCTLSQAILIQHQIMSATLVTSDFHMERAKLIFSELLPNISFNFVSAITPLPKQELDALIAHEKVAIVREKENIAQYNKQDEK
ncbi:YdcF family protein [Thalassotalea sediminis]|uniref:YdcF family protein n=1 Tax=Thalassotalea sediminis TaxID=1759089 RepID=UPI002573939D|nr:YdcF family protein [Thalassotalea sediminis]